MRTRQLLSGLITFTVLSISAKGQQLNSVLTKQIKGVRATEKMSTGTAGAAKTTALSSRLTAETHTNYNGAYYEPQDSSIYSYSNNRGGDLNSDNLYFDSSFLWKYTPGTSFYSNKERAVQTFDGRANMLSQTVQVWDIASSSWLNDSRILYTYDSKNNLLSSITQNWNAIAVNWVNLGQYLYTYDANDKQVTEVYQNWIVSSSAWRNNYKYTHTYDAAGNVTSELYQEWDNFTSLWDNQDMHLYTFNAAKMLTYTHQYWSTMSNAWKNDVKTSYGYDTTYNNQISMLSQTWDAFANNWRNNNQHLYTYDSIVHANIIKDLYQTWGFSSWSNNSQTFYTYNTTNDKLTETGQTWSSFSASWKNSYLHTSTYDSRHNQLSHTEQAWSSSQSIFINSRMYTRVYNNFDQLVSITSNTWNAGGFWQPVSSDYENRYYYQQFGETSIQNASLGSNTVVIYPSPAQNMINIDVEGQNTQAALISIYDLQGRLWKQWSAASLDKYHTTMSVSDLPAGNYFLQIRNENDKTVKAFTVVH